MKKIAKVALVFAAIFSLGLISCGKSSGSSGTSSNGASDAYKKQKKEKDPATKKVYDFGGMDIVVGDWWTNPDEAPKTPFEEDRKKWRNWVQDTYNFKMVQKSVGSWENQPTFVANFCTTGGDENYVVVIDGRSALSGMKAGLFYDWSKIKDIDWTNPKWVESAKNKLMKGDSFYAVRPLVSEPRGGVYFNKRLLKEAGINPDEIYDLQKSGKWNWTTFEEMLKKTTRDIDNDGVIDTWGMANLSTEFCCLALMSNNAQLIGKDASGKYFNDVGSENSIEAFNWVQQMVKNYEKPTPQGANWDWMYSAFKNGEVAFEIHQVYWTGDLADIPDDWGFVCFPLGPKGDNKYKTLQDDFTFAIPAIYGDERASKIGKAFDLWSMDVPGYGNDTWKEDYYPRFRDSRAVDETLQNMNDNGIARYDGMIPGLNTGDIIWNVYPGYSTIQEKYESTKNSWQALIDEANK
jgi:multiple sugar transport system substrate-binding protein